MYDPTNSTTVRRLLLKKTNGVYTSWSYNLADGSAWGTHNYDYFSYLTADRILAAWNNRGKLSEDLEGILETNTDNFAVYHEDGRLAASITDGVLTDGDGTLTQLLLDGAAYGTDSFTAFYMPMSEPLVIRSGENNLSLSLIRADRTDAITVDGGEVAIIPGVLGGSMKIEVPEGDGYRISSDPYGDTGYEIDGIAGSDAIELP